jgi:valyl-tRNA synthetase
LEFQKKFNSSNEDLSDNYYNNPILHLENIKNLNEKIFDLSEDNSYLKQEIQKVKSNMNNNIYSSNSPTIGVNSTQMNTLEVNNGINKINFLYKIFGKIKN